MSLRPALLLATATSLTALVLTACGGPSPATSEAEFTLSGSDTTVGVLDGDLGRVLVGQGDRTLYLFDGAGACTDACALQFPPYTATGVPVAADPALNPLDTAELGTSPEGQVTYRGVPLHYYLGDDAPGEFAGQELTVFGGTFHAVSPAGTKVVS